jgi:hypothetical protein
MDPSWIPPHQVQGRRSTASAQHLTCQGQRLKEPVHQENLTPPCGPSILRGDSTAQDPASGPCPVPQRKRVLPPFFYAGSHRAVKATHILVCFSKSMVPYCRDVHARSTVARARTSLTQPNLCSCDQQSARLDTAQLATLAALATAIPQSASDTDILARLSPLNLRRVPPRPPTRASNAAHLHVLRTTPHSVHPPGGTLITTASITRGRRTHSREGL